MTCDEGQDEPQTEPDEGVDGSNDPQGGVDDPGGLVEDSSHHSDDDDEGDARDGPHLRAAEAETRSLTSPPVAVRGKSGGTFLPSGSSWRPRATGV